MIRTFQAAHVKPRNDNNVLNQRDIINAIDNCPQIIREDKLFLRTKIKQFFKDYQLGDQNPSEDIAQILQIFNQCRKPLSKIHLYDNHLHWLQVRLRKYINNQRKKQKIECLNQFKRQKINQQYKKMNTIRKRYKNDEFGQTKYYWPTQYDQVRNHTQEVRRLQSPPNKVQNNRLIGSSHNRNLSANMSPSHQMNNFYQIKSCKNATSRLANGADIFGFKDKRSTSKESHRKQNILPNNKIDNIQNAQRKIQSLSQGKLRKNKENQANNKILSNQSEHQIVQSQHHPQHFYNKQNVHQKSKLLATVANQQLSNKFEDISLDHWSPYKYDSKEKKPSDISSIKQANHPAHSVVANSLVSNFQPGYSSDSQSLYTSPQLLEQCRRLIKFSNRQAQFKSFGKSQHNQKAQPANQYNPYKASLANAPSEFKTVKEVLKYIFTINWKVYLTSSQRQAILKRCNSSIYEKVENILGQTNNLNKSLNFLQIFHEIKNLGISFAFGNVFQLLDVQSKGFINPIDYQVFIQNFEQCPIEPQVLLKLKDHLKRFEDVVCQKFAGVEIVPGCFQEIFQLCQVLQLFQFQIDSNHNSILHQQ